MDGSCMVPGPRLPVCSCPNAGAPTLSGSAIRSPPRNASVPAPSLRVVLRLRPAHTAVLYDILHDCCGPLVLPSSRSACFLSCSWTVSLHPNLLYSLLRHSRSRTSHNNVAVILVAPLITLNRLQSPIKHTEALHLICTPTISRTSVETGPA